MSNRTPVSRIVIDARVAIDGRPVALYEALKKPWLAVHLDAARDAGVLDKVTVVAAPEHLAEVASAVSKHLAGTDVPVTAEMPDPSGALVLNITRVYLRHRLVRLMKRGAGYSEKLVIFEIARASDVDVAGSFVFRDMWLPLARPFNMPAARKLALWLRNTPVTPNQVTLAGGLLRVGAAVAAGFGAWAPNIVAALMIEAAWTLDLTDGYLARLTGRSSDLGAWLDTFSDEVGTVVILAAIAVGSMRATGEQIWLYAGLGALAASYLTSFGFWYGRLNTSAEATETLSDHGANRQPGASAVLRRAVSFVLGTYRSIDARPHILAAGLLLNVPYVLVSFFAVAGGVSLVRYLQLQLKGRGL